ncbi:MAG TPA: cyclic nucleotide-binding domain-containing protein [Anaeromyxobacteraceae bacterium]|nr:cyclic nucleotide-binding domain-containing protein [Anaeromyxobacteraceae bacterium]
MPTDGVGSSSGSEGAVAARHGSRQGGIPLIATVEKVLFLGAAELFAALPGEDLARIALLAEEEQRGAGEEIFHEGEIADALYLIVEGRVRVLKANSVVAELGEREVFGEMALLDPAPRSATVQAATNTVLLRIRREDFQDLLAEELEVARAVIRVLARRLRAAMPQTPG